ncbi:MAG: thioesterase [Muribaculum sp.]|nr:thioesterase [Muribaculum sp.]
MEPIYSETFFLSAGETNAEQEMSLPLLVSKFIDIATAHANSLGIGNPSMAHMNAGWVLSRLTVEMDSYPKVNDTYKISTWMESFNRHFSLRVFKVESADGKVFGYARSVWMVMSTVDHSNVGLGHLSMPDSLVDGTKVPIETQQRHVPIVAPDFEGEMPKGALRATEPPVIYRFKYCDLDSYRHVNTVRYVVLLLNRFSLEEHDAAYVNRLELSFLHEAKYGMETCVMRSDASDGLLSSFQISNNSDGTPLFFARLLRKPRI